jgi:hypothetical protein
MNAYSNRYKEWCLKTLLRIWDFPLSDLHAQIVSSDCETIRAFVVTRRGGGRPVDRTLKILYLLYRPAVGLNQSPVWVPVVERQRRGA